MPSRLSRLLSRMEAQKEAEVQEERARNAPTTTEPLPAYEPGNDAPPESPQAPLDVTAGFNNLSLSESTGELPRTNQCIAHLKLLECFHRLRQRIGQADGLYGIDNSLVTGPGVMSEDKTPELLAKLAEKRWAIFVSRAVSRFERWSSVIVPDAKPITLAELEEIGKKGELMQPSASKPPLKFDANNMPPVDVLMVWHAYMLNPRAFLEDCLRMGRMQLWHAGLPWQAVADCINAETFAYKAVSEAEETFTKATGLAWQNGEDQRPAEVTCPRCNKQVEVPLTTCSDYPPRNNNLTPSRFPKAIDYMLESGHGYCDKDFQRTCSNCMTKINHELLAVAKFCNDLKALKHSDVPMSGTLLSLKGIPFKHGEENDVMAPLAIKTPNVVVQELTAELLSDHNNMDDVRTVIEGSLWDRAFRKVMHEKVKVQGTKMFSHERIAIRRMMSRYWNNSSPFALDLVGAVIRQGSFIEKMHNIDWLHSPALLSTMKRLITKYTRFVSIMADKSNMAVPTLDVDLAWHTHQLSPLSYLNYTVAETHQFIDHDDKVAETKLNDAFAWTSKRYYKLYKEPYSECTCWYCEAIRESNTSAASRLFRKTNHAEDALHAAEQDPSKSVHISTHNAVRPTDDSKYTAEAKEKADRLEKSFQKACERARKSGRPVPKRDDFYYSDAYGYPVYIPAYSPFVGARWAIVVRELVAVGLLLVGVEVVEDLGPVLVVLLVDVAVELLVEVAAAAALVVAAVVVEAEEEAVAEVVAVDVEEVEAAEVL